MTPPTSARKRKGARRRRSRQNSTDSEDDETNPNNQPTTPQRKELERAAKDAARATYADVVDSQGHHLERVGGAVTGESAGSGTGTVSSTPVNAANPSDGFFGGDSGDPNHPSTRRRSTSINRQLDLTKFRKTHNKDGTLKPVRSPIMTDRTWHKLQDTKLVSKLSQVEAKLTRLSSRWTRTDQLRALQKITNAAVRLVWIGANGKSRSGGMGGGMGGMGGMGGSVGGMGGMGDGGGGIVDGSVDGIGLDAGGSFSSFDKSLAAPSTGEQTGGGRTQGTKTSWFTMPSGPQLDDFLGIVPEHFAVPPDQLRAFMKRLLSVALTPNETAALSATLRQLHDRK